MKRLIKKNVKAGTMVALYDNENCQIANAGCTITN